MIPYTLNTPDDTNSDHLYWDRHCFDCGRRGAFGYLTSKGSEHSLCEHCEITYHALHDKDW